MQPSEIYYNWHPTGPPGRYCQTPSGYSSGSSSAVSTPALTPNPAVMEGMFSHQPAWMTGKPAYTPPEAMLNQVLHLQQQTNQLINALKEQQFHQQQQQQQHVYPHFAPNAHPYMRGPPVYASPPSPAPQLAMNGGGGYQEAIHVAQSVLASSPQVDEHTLARAVVAAANALIANASMARAGNISSLRATPPPAVIMPTAVRSQTPAWLTQAAENAVDSSQFMYLNNGVVLTQFRGAADPAGFLRRSSSPIKHPRSPTDTESPVNSPLADVVLSLSNRDELKGNTPVFGGGPGKSRRNPQLKSPGTVTKCTTQLDQDDEEPHSRHRVLVSDDE